MSQSQSVVTANDSMKSNEEPAQAQAAKKTRELPNLSECHSCHMRVDIANASAKSKLQLLYSEWRVVLLCKKCFARVRSSELCSYCFTNSSFQDSFSCPQCNRRVHRHCHSENRSPALGSDSCSALEFSVCADCWVPESLAKWRGVVSSLKARRSGKRRVGLGLGLGKSRVLAMADDIREIDDGFGGEEGSSNGRDEDDAEKLCTPNLSVCGCDSWADVGCLKLDMEQENGNDDDDDGDGQLKEGEGSCSNGVDLESPAFDKQEQEDCVCITTPKEQMGKAKLDPFYFKYRKRNTVERPCLTYKRRGPKTRNACYMFTYERRPKGPFPSFMLTYKRRRRRTTMIYSCAIGSSSEL